MATYKYIDPLFQSLLDSVPQQKKKASSHTFGISKRIHQILSRRGLSQADLARMTGKKEAEVCKWMSGTHNFTIRTIALIETALDEDILEIKSDSPRHFVDGYASAGSRRPTCLSEPEGPEYGASSLPK